MFRSIGKYFRALGYLVTGRVDAARRALSSNPYVVQATYDRIVDEKKKRVHQYKDAIARMIAQEEKKISLVKSLTAEVNQLEQLKEGAAAKARIIVKDLKDAGVSGGGIKENAEYVKCMTAYNDFASTSAEKSARIEELEGELTEISGSIKSHKVQLQGLMREVEKIKEESAEAVADMITSKEEQEIADMLSGISADRTSQELTEMRELRAQQKAGARVSKELAGTDTKAQEAEFLEYARKTAATSEFDRLIGLEEEAMGEAGGSALEASPEEEKPGGRGGVKLPE